MSEESAGERNAREQIKERRDRRLLGRLILFGVLGFFLLVGGCVVAIAVGIAVSGDSEPTTSPRSSGSGAAPVRILSANVEAMVVSSIEDDPQVLDAAVSQDGVQLSLVLVVSTGVDSQRARTLGENFVRLVKSLSPDDPPGAEIGEGIYDYLIGVYYPNEKKVAQGAKSRVARSVSW